jgi:HEAT repeat protein/beta-lactamase regulating signal transducer with metallopeptidase domain
VWTAAFAALLLVPLAVPLAPDWSLPLLPATLTPSVDNDGGARSPAMRPPQGIAAGRSAAAVELTSADPGAELVLPGDVDAARAIPWTALAIAAWAAGAILLLGQLGVAVARAARLCRRARALDDPAWNDLLEKLRARLDLRAHVRLVCSDTTRVPMAWGLRRHHVVLPADAESWSRERREVVLLHELAHIRRGDCLAHLLSGVVAALYWPHPLVWLARRRQVADCELACDDAVLASGARGADYAWHLLEIARGAGNRLSLAPAGVMMARQSQLEGRLIAALDGSRDRRRLSRLGAAVPTVAGLLIAVALAGLQPWATPEAQQRVVQAPQPAVQAQAAQAAQPVAQAQAAQEPQPVTQEPRPVTQEPQLVVQERAAPPAQPAQRVAQAPRQVRPAPEPEEPDEEDAELSGPTRERVRQMFIGLLDDPDVSIRQQAVQSLGQMEDPAAVRALSEVLVGDTNPEVRAQAAWALGMTESPDALAALGQVMSDSDANVRAQAAWALGMLESEAAVSLLLPALKDTERNVREQAVWALGMTESENAVSALLTTLKQDADPGVRQQAAWALGMIENDAALEALIDAVEDENTEVRKQALWAVSMIVD